MAGILIAWIEAPPHSIGPARRAAKIAVILQIPGIPFQGQRGQGNRI